MSNELCENAIQTSPAQEVPPVAPNQAVTFRADFDRIQKIVCRYTPPKRPNRSKPDNSLQYLINSILEPSPLSAQEEKALDDVLAKRTAMPKIQPRLLPKRWK